MHSNTLSLLQRPCARPLRFIVVVGSAGSPVPKTPLPGKSEAMLREAPPGPDPPVYRVPVRDYYNEAVLVRRCGLVA